MFLLTAERMRRAEETAYQVADRVGVGYEVSILANLGNSESDGTT